MYKSNLFYYYCLGLCARDKQFAAVLVCFSKQEVVLTSHMTLTQYSCGCARIRISSLDPPAHIAVIRDKCSASLCFETLHTCDHLTCSCCVSYTLFLHQLYFRTMNPFLPFVLPSLSNTFVPHAICFCQGLHLC